MSHALAQLGLQAFISDKMGYAQAEREIGGREGEREYTVKLQTAHD